MKNIISIIAFGVGAALAVLGLSMGASTSIFLSDTGITFNDTTLEDKKLTINEDVDSVTINADTANIYISSGESLSMVYNTFKSASMKYEVNGSSVDIEFDTRRAWGFNLSFFVSNDPTPTIDLTIPSTVKSIVIINSLGVTELIDLDDIENLDVDNDLGEITLENISSQNIHLNSEVGEVQLENITSENVKIHASLGNIFVEECELYDANITGDTSNIIINESKIANDLFSHTALGNVKAEIFSSEDNFNLNLSVSLGEVLLNGDKYSNEYTSQNGDSSITLSSEVGEVHLEFYE